jgi:diaminopimelate decarboxylase
MELPRSFDGAEGLAIDVLPHTVRTAVEGLRGRDPVAAYLYDLDAARTRASALKSALPAAHRVLFAMKSNSFPPLATALAGTVDGFEVSSVAEAALAFDACAAAGVRPRLTVSGPAKNSRLLDDLLALAASRAAPADAVTVAAESLLEVHRLSAVAAARQHPVPVLLRVNPAWTPVAVERAVGLTMGGVPGPFGLPETDVPAAIDAVCMLPGLRFAGFHTHAVSGNLDAKLHAEYVRHCLEWAVRTAAAHRIPLTTVDVGGGLGYAFEGGAEFDVAGFSAALEPPPAGVEVVLEPGRWLAAPIGWYATEVVDVKHSYGETFVVVRGGINHFQLPTSWEIRHNFAVVPVEEWPGGMPRPSTEGESVTVAGELCTPEDVLARGVRVGRVRAGDVLVFPNAGAYGFEFAMPAFLGHPPAARIALAPVRARGGSSE